MQKKKNFSSPGPPALAAPPREHGLQGENHRLNTYGRPGVFPEEILHHPLTDQPAVLIVGLNQHQDILGGAAAGCDVAGAQAFTDLTVQLPHGPGQAVGSEGLAAPAEHREHTDVDGVSPPCGRPGLCLIEQLFNFFKPNALTVAR